MKCQICKREIKVISSALKCCRDCIINFPKKAYPYILKAHKLAREPFSLPYPPPSSKSGVKCEQCLNRCQLKEDEISFCGMKKNEKGKLKRLAGDKERGILEWYFDPLPTNCVASFVCEGSKMTSMENLALFYGSCSFDCLFCQNWHFRFLSQNLSPSFSASEIIAQIKPTTFCICFFGGDPSPQFPHVREICDFALKKGIRICFETNGGASREIIKKMAQYSLFSQGIIKFDLKAFNENLHFALTGVSNKNTLENFEFIAKTYLKKAKKPFLVASTLIVPGYVEKEEIEKIARFIASLDPEIPYSILAFSPQFLMKDLPLVSKKLAFECFEAAKKAGLLNVNLANLHLLV